MTDTVEAPAPPPELDRRLAALTPCEIVVGLPTYNNAATVPAIVAVVRAGLAARFAGASAAVVNVDAGSTDRTPELLAEAGMPCVLARHEAPSAERAAVPFHGVPGRDAALRSLFDVAGRLQARVLVLLEADVTSITEEWIERLVRAVWEAKADLVTPAYVRHRYEGTITNLLLAPLVRTLFGRRLRQPFGGAFAVSARLLSRALAHPVRPTTGRDVVDLWLTGTAIADGFTVCEAWLGPRHVESRTRTTDLPTMLSQALGAVFTLMERDEGLWLDVAGSEPVSAVGDHAPPSAAPATVSVDRMLGAFRRGLRDLIEIWELVLAPETLEGVLGLDARDVATYRFPDRLWAQVVFDFALGHRFGVVHREHLLRSLVPLYLGRTAAFVTATQSSDGAETEAALERVGAAFEAEKRYLTERWR
jgi:hypothetical protein